MLRAGELRAGRSYFSDSESEGDRDFARIPIQALGDAPREAAAPRSRAHLSEAAAPGSGANTRAAAAPPVRTRDVQRWEDPDGPQRSFGLEVNYANRLVAINMVKEMAFEPKWNDEVNSFQITLPQEAHPQYVFWNDPARRQFEQLTGGCSSKLKGKKGHGKFLIITGPRNLIYWEVIYNHKTKSNDNKPIFFEHST